MREVVQWLLAAHAKIPPLDALLEALWPRVVTAGIPVDRIAMALRTLHPELLGLGYVWRRGKPLSVNEHPLEELKAERFQRSPFMAIFRGEGPFHCAVADAAWQKRFPILVEMAEDGLTDYLALPIVVSTGERHSLTFATRQPEGFSDDQVRDLLELASVLAPIVEARETRRLAATLLDTYVGPRAGARILRGDIVRGAAEQITAALFWCDLRGFTSLSVSLPPETLMSVLDRYFDAVCAPVLAAGGDVLKFIGDGVLAAFPLEDRPVADVCAATLQSARLALRALAERSADEVRAGRPPLRAGAALHIGRVAFGNVGARTRLDFTVIGPAVNLVSRISGLCSPLGEPLLASEEFAAFVPAESRPLGEHPIRGLDQSITLRAYDA